MKRPAVAALIAVFLCVAVGASGYFLLVGPRKGEIDTKQKEIESTQSQIQSEKSTFKELSDIRNRSAEYEARLASLQAKIPEEPDLPSLIRNLQAAADAGTGAGLPWMSFSPGEVTAGEEGGEVSSYSFNMSVAGFYDEIVDLIYRMEKMQRAVIIDSITLTSTESILEMVYNPNLGLAEASIDAKAFTFAEPPGAVTAPPPAAPGPGPGENGEGAPAEEEGMPGMQP